MAFSYLGNPSINRTNMTMEGYIPATGAEGGQSSSHLPGAYLRPLLPAAANSTLGPGGGGWSGRQGGVEMYTVIVSTISMLAFGALGLLSNLALLVSTKCKKSIRHIQYGLPYCLAAVNVLFCAIWVPLEVLRLVLNYSSFGLYAIVCHVDVALFYFCIGTLVFINVFISIHRILLYLSIGLLQSTYIMAGICVSTLLGVIFAVGVSMDYERTLDYRICTQTWLATEPRLSIAAVAVNTLWVLVLLIICSSLLAIVILQRKSMANPQKMRGQASMSKDYICPRQSDDLEEAKQRFLNSIPEGGNKPHSITKKKSVTKNVSVDGSKKKLTFGDTSKKGSDSDGSENDDDYDQRMKLKLQKSLSGRRHTVANIGLGESSFGGGRRGSMDRTKLPGGGYSYIRKWSVDIVALQDQLENPKAYLSGAASASGALSTLTDKDTSKTKSTSSNKITGSITEEEQEGKSSVSTKPKAGGSGEAETGSGDGGGGGAAEKTRDNQDDSVIEEEPKVNPSPPGGASGGRDAGGDGGVGAGAGGSSKGAGEGGGEGREEGGGNDTNVANGCSNPNDHLSAVDSSANENVDDDCEPVLDKKEMIQSIQINVICLILMVTVLTSVLPYALLHFLQPLMDTSLNRNLMWVLAGLCVIQTPIHTLLLAWMERKLWHGLRRLRVKLTHWRCVCYCNIGKGRQCFTRPERGDTSSNQTC